MRPMRGWVDSLHFNYIVILTVSWSSLVFSPRVPCARPTPGDAVVFVVMQFPLDEHSSAGSLMLPNLVGQ